MKSGLVGAKENRIENIEGKKNDGFLALRKNDDRCRNLYMQMKNPAE